MRFLGRVRVQSLGWLAVAVVGGLSACGESDNLVPFEPTSSATGSGTGVNPQVTSAPNTSSTGKTSAGGTSSAPSSSTSQATSSSGGTSSTATTSRGNPTTSSDTEEDTTTAATSSTNGNTSTAQETSDETETSAATSAGETTGGGGKPAPEPSDGCGNANPATGSSGQPLMVSGHQYYVKLPQGYDPEKPYPVVIMFNPTGNPISWAEGAAGFEAAAKDAIRVYPHMANQSSGWGPGDADFFAPFHEKSSLITAWTKRASLRGAKAPVETSWVTSAARMQTNYAPLLRGHPRT